MSLWACCSGLLGFCCYGRQLRWQRAINKCQSRANGYGRRRNTGSWASRCFSFGVLARKGQLRAALNEAGSHPINCLVQWKSCSLDWAAQKKRPLHTPTHPPPSSHHRLHPKLEQEVMDQTFEKLYASIRQSYFMLHVDLLTLGLVHAWMSFLVCRHVCCAPGRVW